MIELVNKLIQWSGWSWRWHLLAIVLGIIVALVMTFLPAEYLASLNALLDLAPVPLS